MKKIITFILLLFASITFSGCDYSDDVQADIYTSIYPIEFLTKEIVKEELIVRNAYPRGADVHDFEIAARTIVRMSQSSAIFYIGAGLEAFIENAKNSTFKNVERVIALSDYVPLLERDGPACEDGHGHSHFVDEHIWLDPLRMITMAEVILENVIDIAPDKEEFFRNNTDDLIERLVELDEYFINALKDPQLVKYMLVDHDAYLYWSERYELKSIRTRVNNHSTDFPIQDFIRNLELIEHHKLTHIIITENESVSNVVDQYVRGAKLQVATLQSVATITNKQLQQGHDYISLMKTNLDVIIDTLPKN